MIHEVDASLRALIERDLGKGTEISFEAPTRDWAAKRTKPTINTYLYDIREDRSRREVAYEEVRDDKGRVIERRRPPRRFRLSYLVTAWAQRPEDEHRLLSDLLTTFVRQDYIPEELLHGSLVDAGKVVVATVAVPLSDERQISEVWTSLGGELKPSLDLAIVAPLDVAVTLPAGPPVTEQPRFVVARPDEVIPPPTKGDTGNEFDREPAAVSPASPGRWSAQETIRAGRQELPGRVVRVRQWPPR